MPPRVVGEWCASHLPLFFPHHISPLLPPGYEFLSDLDPPSIRAPTSGDFFAGSGIDLVSASRGLVGQPGVGVPRRCLPMPSCFAICSARSQTTTWELSTFDKRKVTQVGLPAHYAGCPLLPPRWLPACSPYAGYPLPTLSLHRSQHDFPHTEAENWSRCDARFATTGGTWWIE